MADDTTWEAQALTFLRPDEPPPARHPWTEEEITAAIGPHPGYGSIPVLQDWQRRRRELLNPSKPSTRRRTRLSEEERAARKAKEAARQPRQEKLSDADVLAIRRRKASGETTTELAQHYGVSTRMIDLIVTYKRRANVTA